MDTTIKKPDPIRNYISNGASKKSLCYLAIVLVVALLVFAGLWYYLSRAPKIEEVEEIVEEPNKEEIIREQLKELEELKKEFPPLPEEEIRQQLKELNKIK